MTKLIDDLDLYSDLLASVGTHKNTRPLTPIQVSDLIKRLMDEQNETIQQVSKRLGFKDESSTQTKNFLKLQRLPRQIHHVLGWGDSDPDKVPFTLGVFFSELVNSNDIIKGIRACIDNNIIKNEARRIVDLKKKQPNKTMEDCIEQVKKIRPIVETSYIIANTMSVEVDSQLTSIATQKVTTKQELIKKIVNKTIADGVIGVVIKGKTVFLSMDEDIFNKFELKQKENKIPFDKFLDHIIRKELQNV